MIGFTQSFVSIYSPLWIDDYAPRKNLTGWMSYSQGAVPLGVMGGYLIGVLASGFGSSRSGCFGLLCWRWPFILPFVALVPIVVGIFCVPTEHLSIHAQHRCHAESRDDEHVSHRHAPPASASPASASPAFASADSSTSHHHRCRSVHEHYYHRHVVMEEEAHRTSLRWTIHRATVEFVANECSARVRLDSLTIEALGGNALTVDDDDACGGDNVPYFRAACLLKPSSLSTFAPVCLKHLLVLQLCLFVSLRRMFRPSFPFNHAAKGHHR